MRRFSEWVDRVVANEPPPEGLDREIFDRVVDENSAASATEKTPPADLYAVVAGLTALATEVKLQGRTFKDLCGTLEPVTGHGEVLTRLAALVEERLGGQVEERVREAEHRTRASLVTVLLDVRDRLERGLKQARRRLGATAGGVARGRRFLRFLGRRAEKGHEEREALKAFEKGYALGLSRIDQTLVELGITVVEIGPGGAFDPRTMNAVDVQEAADVPEGTVREVFRNGYLWNGEVLRTAEVKVARAPIQKARSRRGDPDEA
jgi:molecular chaperone GrpE